jgi:kynurenine formamidase
MTEGGLTVENLSPELLIRPAVVIDVRHVATGHYLLDPGTIQQWESTHGVIEKGNVVLLNTGWDRYWKAHDDETYLDWLPDEHEPGGRLGTGYPGYSLEAARFLAEERGVVGLGIDTAGIDGGLDTAFSVNRYWLRGERYHLENLTALDRLPPRGATIFIGALPIEKGSGSPVRVLAMVP